MRSTPRRALTIPAVTLALILFAAAPDWSPVLAAAIDVAPATITGHWDGAIHTPGPKLAINIDFRRGDDGAFAGDITIPMKRKK